MRLSIKDSFKRLILLSIETEIRLESKKKADESKQPEPDLKLDKLTSDPDGLKVIDVDQDGDLIEVLVQKRKDTKAAKRFF